MATKTVFTIGRQFGSGGRIIGKMLAKQLGIPFYDKELLTEAAKESGISEELFESLDEKPASNFLYAMVMGNYAYSQAGTGAGMTINDRLVQAQTKAIEDIASKGGAVIVGRCADYVLRDHPHGKSIHTCSAQRESAESGDRLRHDRAQRDGRYQKDRQKTLVLLQFLYGQKLECGR